MGKEPSAPSQASCVVDKPCATPAVERAPPNNAGVQPGEAGAHLGQGWAKSPVPLQTQVALW
eukprot:7585092-Lingulodinium_polyedra.AAC.1